MGVLYVLSKFEELDKDRKAHSLGVANVSRYLAKEKGLIENFSYMCGMFHDIGYVKGNSSNHAKCGYEILNKNKLTDVAWVALLHSMSIKVDTSIHSVLKRRHIPETIKDYIEIVSVADSIVDNKGKLVGETARLSSIQNIYGKDSMQVSIGEINKENAYNWLNKHNIKLEDIERDDIYG